MKILAIETSCDETAIAIVEANGDEQNARFRVLGNALISQIDIHKEYGGVFPAIAKREHTLNLVPLMTKALSDATLLNPLGTPTQENSLTLEIKDRLKNLERFFLHLRKT